MSVWLGQFAILSNSALFAFCTGSLLPGQAVEQTVKLSLVYDAITLKWRHCIEKLYLRLAISTNNGPGGDFWPVHPRLLIIGYCTFACLKIWTIFRLILGMKTIGWINRIRRPSWTWIGPELNCYRPHRFWCIIRKLRRISVSGY